MSTDPIDLIKAAQNVLHSATTEQLIVIYRRASVLLTHSDNDQRRHASTVRGWIYTEILNRGNEEQLAAAEGVCADHWMPVEICPNC